MESNEIQMSSSTPVTLGGAFHESRVETGHSFGKTAANPDVPRIQDAKDDFADQLLHAAKEEGLEGAIVHLANGDFEKSDEVIVVEEIHAEEVQEISEITQVEDGEIESNQIDAGDDRTDIEANGEGLETHNSRVEMLEVKATQLEEQNKELFENIKSLESKNTLAMQAMLEMTIIMHEMLKEEEDDEEKISGLEMIILLLSKLMKAMFVPEETEPLYEAGQQMEKPGSSSRHNGAKMDRVVKRLQDQGKIRTDDKISQMPQNEILQAA